MSGKKGANRQRQGCKSRFSVAHFGKRECISNVWSTKVIFPELVDFNLI